MYCLRNQLNQGTPKNKEPISEDCKGQLRAEFLKQVFCLFVFVYVCLCDCLSVCDQCLTVFVCLCQLSVCVCLCCFVCFVRLCFSVFLSVFFCLCLLIFGYWLGGRPSAADLCESARIHADSARFRGDPPDVRQKYFLADSAERPANFRRTPAKYAQIRGDPRGLRGELAVEFNQKMSADKNLPYTTVPHGKTSAADVLPPRK